MGTMRGQRPPTENSSSLIRKNHSIEDQTFKSQNTGTKGNNSFLGGSKPNTFLMADKIGLKSQGANILSNKNDAGNNSFVNRNNVSEMGYSSSKKMQLETSESRDFRDQDPIGQLSSRAYALLAEEQDELIEEHSNQIDDLVACIKEDMGILKNVKDTRNLISD
jgi:hypothetical protein